MFDNFINNEEENYKELTRVDILNSEMKKIEEDVKRLMFFYFENDLQCSKQEMQAKKRLSMTLLDMRYRYIKLKNEAFSCRSKQSIQIHTFKK